MVGQVIGSVTLEGSDSPGMKGVCDEVDGREAVGNIDGVGKSRGCQADYSVIGGPGGVARLDQEGGEGVSDA